MLNYLELTGQARTHINQLLTPRFAAHKEVAESFLKMRETALKEGITLVPFSSFRDFKTQCRIWNMKFLGKKPLYDENGIPRDYDKLSLQERIDCILNWSAIPGGSRHHWGTEIDVVDGSKMPSDYQVKLLPEEVQEGGIFFKLHQWLDENIQRFGFFRPYAKYQGGMYCEPWHLSYAPVSIPALESLNLDMLEKAIQSVDLEGKELLLDNLPKIFDEHINNICMPN